MNFGALRVLNDDLISGGTGFDTHSHKNMEIVSIPIFGALRHEDSQGHRSIIRQGEVQVMSAGAGIAHSEYNASETEDANFLQIWILPKQLEVPPRYDQKEFDLNGRVNTFQLVVSPDGREGSLRIHQDAFFSLASLAGSRSLTYRVRVHGHGLYLFMIGGEITSAGERLRARDAIGLTGVSDVAIDALSDAQILAIEVPA